MLLHASCAVRDGIGVLIRGAPGSGKSSLLLRLLVHGFEMVADDCVLLDDGVARSAEALCGLLEVRGLGIYRRSWCASARVGLVVEAGRSRERIAERRVCSELGVPVIMLELLLPTAPDIVSLAVGCLAGQVHQVAGPL